jgi:hypothetical protein
MADSVSLLTAFQIEVAYLFFTLPASDEFLLAGGGALLAQGLTARPTQDLDFFTRPSGGDVRRARDEFIAAAGDRAGPLAVYRTVRPSAAYSFTATRICLLAGRKVVALFDRAAARDFVDVYALSRTFAKTELLELAREVDAGFDVAVFIDMIGYLARYRDVDLALGDVDVDALRVFFRQWAAELQPDQG